VAEGEKRKVSETHQTNTSNLCKINLVLVLRSLFIESMSTNTKAKPKAKIPKRAATTVQVPDASDASTVAQASVLDCLEDDELEDEESEVDDEVSGYGVSKYTGFGSFNNTLLSNTPSSSSQQNRSTNSSSSTHPGIVTPSLGSSSLPLGISSLQNQMLIQQQKPRSAPPPVGQFNDQGVLCDYYGVPIPNPLRQQYPVPPVVQTQRQAAARSAPKRATARRHPSQSNRRVVPPGNLHTGSRIRFSNGHHQPQGSLNGNIMLSDPNEWRYLEQGYVPVPNPYHEPSSPDDAPVHWGFNHGTDPRFALGYTPYHPTQFQLASPPLEEPLYDTDEGDDQPLSVQDFLESFSHQVKKDPTIPPSTDPMLDPVITNASNFLVAVFFWLKSYLLFLKNNALDSVEDMEGVSNFLQTVLKVQVDTSTASAHRFFADYLREVNTGDHAFSKKIHTSFAYSNLVDKRLNFLKVVSKKASFSQSKKPKSVYTSAAVRNDSKPGGGLYCDHHSASLMINPLVHSTASCTKNPKKRKQTADSEKIED
jgi:hypothetical protein